MRKLVIILNLYGLTFFSTLILVTAPFYSNPIYTLPHVTTGTIIELTYFSFVPFGLMALLYFTLSKSSKSKQTQSVSFQTLFWLLAIFQVIGQILHAITNTAHNAIIQSNNTEMLLNNAEPIVFLDEFASHVLIFGSVLGLSALLIKRQAKYKLSHKLNTAEVFSTIACSILFGIGLGVSLIEATMAFWMWPAILIVLMYMAHNLNYRDYEKLQFLPVWLFYSIGYTTLLLVLFGWYTKFGGFIEPSKLALY